MRLNLIQAPTGLDQFDTDTLRETFQAHCDGLWEIAKTAYAKEDNALRAARLKEFWLASHNLSRAVNGLDSAARYANGEGAL